MAFKHYGYCPICEAPVAFTAENNWFRDFLLCSGCGSIPRERALFRVVRELFPRYAALKIHESSPAPRGASAKLAKVPGYSSSHYLPTVPRGQVQPTTGHRCEDLEALTFPDGTFDLFVTQDVLEHLFNPEKAFAEIARVLKPGGAHIFTVPLVNKARPSERWASLGKDGRIVHDRPAEYHGNPVDAKGSPVTMHWGYDIAARITRTAGTPTMIWTIDDIDAGIRAEYIDVLVSYKV